MRIGIDIKTLKNSTSGIQVFLRNMLDHLQTCNSNHKFFLFEPKPSDYVITNANWKKITTPSKLPGTLWLQLQVPPLLRKHNIDIFWGPEQMCPIFKKPPMKYITTFHDFTFLRFPETMRLVTRLILGLSFRGVVRTSDLLLTDSIFIKSEAIAIFKRQRLKNPPPVKAVVLGSPSWKLPEEYRAADRSEFLLFVGSIEPRKNLPRLIEALTILHGQGFSRTLKIVSPAQWHAKELTKQLAASPMRDNIHFCGFVTSEELRQLYLGCKALIMPSLYEGFGLPVLEALALDCLVLTSKDTVMEEVAKSAALYFDPNNPEDIARCISQAFAPDFTRDEVLIYRDAVLRRFSWQVAAEKMISLFDATALV